MPVNRARGEIEFEVDGRSYILRPSFELLSVVEDATDKGAIELLQLLQTDRCRSKDTVTTLWIAAKANKNNKNVPEIEEFGENIRNEIGLIPASRIMLKFLTVALSTNKQIQVVEDALVADQEGKTKDADPSKPSEDSEETETAQANA